MSYPNTYKLTCDHCGAELKHPQGEKAVSVVSPFPEMLRSWAHERGWRFESGADVCPACSEGSSEHE